ncbi:MAG: hypothetical protein IIA83_08460 [Thaumarchaeota archaeon]|nr:hypothetical protein [Nitrososphaerota archaeon]
MKSSYFFFIQKKTQKIIKIAIKTVTDKTPATILSVEVVAMEHWYHYFLDVDDYSASD